MMFSNPSLCLVEHPSTYHGNPIINPRKAHKASLEEIVVIKDQLKLLYN